MPTDKERMDLLEDYPDMLVDVLDMLAGEDGDRVHGVREAVDILIQLDRERTRSKFKVVKPSGEPRRRPEEKDE